MDLGIAGRVAVVTGGSRGIGLETARMLRDEDTRVLLVARDAGLSLSRLFADRFVRDGVLVNAIAPGAVEGTMWLEPGGLLDQHVEKTGAPDRDQALADVHAARPNGRLATTAEIAAAIVFLCSERASYVSGAAWSVDAGTVQVII